VTVESIIGDRDIRSIPLGPIASLVASDKQDCLPLRIKREKDPQL
jgi:hypothetical protein